jgi:hypothetical protein
MTKVGDVVETIRADSRATSGGPRLSSIKFRDLQCTSFLESS